MLSCLRQRSQPNKTTHFAQHDTDRHLDRNDGEKNKERTATEGRVNAQLRNFCRPVSAGGSDFTTRKTDRTNAAVGQWQSKCYLHINSKCKSSRDLRARRFGRLQD